VAAHLEGKGIITQDAGGLAQKGGSTWSHVLIGLRQDAIRTTRVGMAAADLIMGCDPIVTAGKETLLRMRAGRTRVALNSSSTPTAAFVTHADWANPSQACAATIAQAVAGPDLAAFDAEALAVRTLGDSIYANPMMLGFAWQKGWIPLRRDSLLRAIELNAVAVDSNKAAFEWGRRAAVGDAAVQRMLSNEQVVQFSLPLKQRLDDMVARRAEFLTAYQNAAYAARYTRMVEAVRQAEAAAMGPQATLLLTEAVARYLFKLMAYKDEYEVARLHADPAFTQRLDALFEGKYQRIYHLAPPLLAARDAQGRPRKMRFGPWMLTVMRLLAPLKVLRGTWLDPFGRSAERREERALVADYCAALEAMLPSLHAANREAALAFARLPEQIRGFGHVKARNLAVARARWAELLQQFHQQQSAPKRAA
jgi:indolepyruvate ferredoxin oxidoreductase